MKNELNSPSRSGWRINRCIKRRPETSTILLMQRLDRRILLAVRPEGSDLEEHAKESEDTRQILVK